jgi:hypothetical protein
MTSRDRSPPESTRTFLSISSPENWNAPEQVAQHARRLVRVVVLQLLEHGEVRVQQIERLLGEVAHLQARSGLHGAGVGRERSGDHLQQRRLAGAIPAHHGPPLPAPDRQIQTVVEHPLPKALDTDSSTTT